MRIFFQSFTEVLDRLFLAFLPSFAQASVTLAPTKRAVDINANLGVLDRFSRLSFYPQGIYFSFLHPCFLWLKVWNANLMKKSGGRSS